MAGPQRRQVVSPGELQAARARPTPASAGAAGVATVADLLKAVELGGIDKNEARRMLGLKARRPGAAKQPRERGRFARTAEPKSTA